MTDLPGSDPTRPTQLDIRRETARSAWKDDPVVGFEHKASLAIADRVLLIFGGVCGLSFVATIFLFVRTDATFEKGAELIKFMIQSPLPLVTLAVGDYLGDRSRSGSTNGKSK